MRPQIRSFALGLVLMSASVFAGCGGGSSKPTPGATCVLNSDCASGLICTFGLCHGQCKVNGDCATGSLCVKSDAAGDGGTINVCQLQVESTCVYNSQCQSPLVCARDEHCRNQCVTDVDCVSPQVCTTSKVCALTSQLAPGTTDVPIVTSGLGGAAGGTAGGAGTSGAAGAAGAAAGSSGAAGAAGAGGGAGAAGGGGAAGSTGAAGKGGAGGSSGACSPACGPGTQCVSGACQPCGSSGNVCCANNYCDTNLTCASGTCTCGAVSQACCNGSLCNNGLSCVNGTCSCGGAGQNCCANQTCTGNLICGGQRCGCTAACDHYAVMKNDGSIMDQYTGKVVANLDASLFKAISVSENGTFGCGVQADHTVWCWGSNTYGALGHGEDSTTLSSSPNPVQVLTQNGTSTPPLTKIASVQVADTGYNACALDMSGGVWCWGYGYYGQLGNGTKGANSLFAAPVVVDSTNAALTGVAQIAVSYYHVCVLKTDKTVWCWGDNQWGEIGNGKMGTSTTPELYPVQVPKLMNTATSVATMDAPYPVSCATTVDGGVWCWGTNYYGELGNGRADSNNALIPAAVLTDATASTALTGAVKVVNFTSRYGMCVLKTDATVWCWGNNQAAGYVAARMVDNAQNPVGGITVIGRDCYLDSSDQPWIDAAKASYPVTCP